MRVLLIDNYDSYSFNLYHLIASLAGEAPILVQNDDFGADWDRLLASIPRDDFDCIVVGPGPGTPDEDACLGLSKGAIERTDLGKPVLGVCLGMQAMARAFGGKVIKAPKPMHGRLSWVRSENGHSELFHEVGFPFNVVRYHSLCVDVSACKHVLKVTSVAEDDGVIMSLEHVSRPLYGVQYHPESICAGKEGPKIVDNFLQIAARLSASIPKSINFSPPATRHKASSDDAETNDSVLIVREVDYPECDAEAIFEQIFAENSCRAWLDSAMHHPKRGQVSIFCGESGCTRFSERLEFFVERPRMEMNLDHEGLRDYGNESMLRSWRIARKNDKNEFVLKEARSGSGCEPFEHMKKALARSRPSRVLFSRAGSPREAPLEPISLADSKWGDFCCGFVGAIGYGVRKLCGVKVVEDHSKEIPVSEAEQRFAGVAPDLAFFFSDRAIVYDLAMRRAYVLALSDKESFREQTSWMFSAAQQFGLAQQPRDRNVCNPQYELRPVKTRAEYEDDVRRCLNEIGSGETYEVCLTNQLFATVPQDRPLMLSALYRSLRKNNPAPFGAFFRFSTQEGRSVTLLSSSPERFLRVDGNGIIESRPIKGTVARGINPVEDSKQRDILLHSEKDRAENLMIVDLVRNDIGRVCKVGSVQVPELFIVETFHTVHQLVSTIQGELQESRTAVDAARVAFPPGSMTGAPKLRTMQIIDDIERGERGFYSGALGFFSCSGAADFAVIIRTVTVVNDLRMSVGAGGAVVAMSDPEQERLEMTLKVKALGQLFRIIEE